MIDKGGANAARILNRWISVAVLNKKTKYPIAVQIQDKICNMTKRQEKVRCINYRNKDDKKRLLFKISYTAYVAEDLRHFQPSRKWETGQMMSYIANFIQNKLGVKACRVTRKP